MPIWLQILFTAVLVPSIGFAVRVLYRVGVTMGRIDEKLDGMDRRLASLESRVNSVTVPARRRGTSQ